MSHIPDRRSPRPLLAAVALSLFALAACGSSGLSRTAYIAKVDPICARYQGEATTIIPPQTGEPTALSNYYTQLADLADKQTKEIDAAGRPKKGAAQIDDLLKRQRIQIDQLRQVAAAIKANDEAKANQIGAAAEPDGKKINADLKAFGFKSCGSAT